jgi:HEAT repeat protein
VRKNRILHCCAALEELDKTEVLGPGDRRAICLALGRIRRPWAAEALVKALGDMVSFVRDTAAKALVTMGEPAIEPLIHAFKSQDGDVVGGALSALGEIGKPAVDQLLRALRDADGDVRCNSAMALGAIGDKRAVVPLIESLKDPDHYVRRWAASSLGKIGDIRAVEALTAALDDSDSSVQEYTNKALELITMSDMKRKEMMIRRDFDRLFDMMHSLSVSRQDRQAAADSIVQLGEMAVDLLINELNSWDEVRRSNACHLLARIGDSRAVQPLINALEEDTPHVKRSAAMALGTLDDPRAKEALSRISQTDKP